MRTVRSGSGVIWPAAPSGFTESHSVSHILIISKKSRKDGYISQRWHLFGCRGISFVFMFSRRLKEYRQRKKKGVETIEFFTHLAVSV